MKKTLATVCALLALGVSAQAASLDYTQLSQQMQEHVILAWSMADNGDVYNPNGVTFSSASSTIAREVDAVTGEGYGHLVSSSTKPWTTDLADTNSGDFTVSFDLNRWNGNAWGAIMGFSSEGAGDAYSMQFGINGSGTLCLYHGPGGATAFGGVTGASSYVSNLKANTDLGWTTLTLVSDATNAVLTLYMDGEAVYTQTGWVAAQGKSLAMSGLQVGAALGGRGSTLVDIDNITIMNVALDEAGVKSLLKTDAVPAPEPATASLSLLALAGLAARRRRK